MKIQDLNRKQINNCLWKPARAYSSHKEIKIVGNMVIPDYHWLVELELTEIQLEVQTADYHLPENREKWNNGDSRFGQQQEHLQR